MTPGLPSMPLGTRGGRASAVRPRRGSTHLEEGEAGDSIEGVRLGTQCRDRPGLNRVDTGGLAAGRTDEPRGDAVGPGRLLKLGSGSPEFASGQPMRPDHPGEERCLRPNGAEGWNPCGDGGSQPEVG